MNQLDFDGILMGVLVFGIIALTRWLCIAGEYWLSKRVWWGFLATGLACIGTSLLVDNVLISSAISVFGYCLLCGIGEVIQQEERVRKGWFPQNPRHPERYQNGPSPNSN